MSPLPAVKAAHVVLAGGAGLVALSLSEKQKPKPPSEAGSLADEDEIEDVHVAMH